jgi:aminoglycoside 6'-N-acetyltransferase I
MARPVVVQQATRDQWEAALHLLERFFLEEGFATPREQIREELLTFLSDDESAVFLAWLDQVAVGVATVTTARGIELGLSAELEDLYVLPKARGRGVGKNLIEAAVKWCQSQGCQSVSVVVTPKGQAVHNLVAYYRARGFEETGRTILLAQL